MGSRRRWDERFLLDEILDAVAQSRPLEEILAMLVDLAAVPPLDAPAAIWYDRVGDRFASVVKSEALPAELVGPSFAHDPETAAAWQEMPPVGAGEVLAVEAIPPRLRDVAAAARLRSVWIWPSEQGDAENAPLIAVAWRTEEHLDVDQSRRKAMARLARLGGLAFERSRPAERALSAVLFTDIVDSTSTAMRMGDAAWRKVLAAHDVMVRSHLARYQGAEVKHTGDGFLATFESPAHAVNCAIDLTAAVQDLGVEIRSGVHVGEVEWREGDVAGACVHIGARIASVAGPSEVLVSRPVTEVVAGSALRFEAGGQRTFKGVAEPWHVFTVEREATTST